MRWTAGLTVYMRSTSDLTIQHELCLKDLEALKRAMTDKVLLSAPERRRNTQKHLNISPLKAKVCNWP